MRLGQLFGASNTRSIPLGRQFLQIWSNNRWRWSSHRQHLYCGKQGCKFWANLSGRAVYVSDFRGSCWTVSVCNFPRLGRAVFFYNFSKPSHFGVQFSKAGPSEIFPDQAVSVWNFQRTGYAIWNFPRPGRLGLAFSKTESGRFDLKFGRPVFIWGFARPGRGFTTLAGGLRDQEVTSGRVTCQEDFILEFRLELLTQHRQIFHYLKVYSNITVTVVSRLNNIQ